jgi:cell division septation protein DedD
VSKSTVLLCLALAACGQRDASPPPDSATRVASTSFVGPDPLFLRIPRTGGAARVVSFPNVDSAVWTSSESAPAPGRVLGFDDDAGLISMVDAKSRPARIDFRRDRIDVPIKTPLNAPASIDGSSIFGVTAKGVVVRTTPSDADESEWHFTPGRPARGALPLRDGSLLVWTDHDRHSVFTRVRPPATTPGDSVVLPSVELVAGTGVGDRLYFAAGRQLYALQTKTLQPGTPIDLGGDVSALAVTPSGDRIYALTADGGGSSLVAVDRYRARILSRIPLAAKARELRVDPVGRFLLVRGARDTVIIVATASNNVVATIHTEWRDDLPLVAPDGSIATVQGRDVVFIAADDHRVVSRIGGAASDFWFAFWWTGFRPRATSLDSPVTFDSSTRASDSATTAAIAVADTARPVTPPASTDTAQTAAKPQGFTVSFFALLSEQRAQAEAAKIRVGDEAAHVETIMRNGVPVYRVILGPYPTCAQAQQAARASGKTVWIPEGGCELPPPSDEPLAH